MEEAFGAEYRVTMLDVRWHSTVSDYYSVQRADIDVEQVVLPSKSSAEELKTLRNSMNKL